MMPSGRVVMAITDKVEHLRIVLHLTRRWARVAQCESTLRLVSIVWTLESYPPTMFPRLEKSSLGLSQESLGPGSCTAWLALACIIRTRDFKCLTVEGDQKSASAGSKKHRLAGQGEHAIIQTHACLQGNVMPGISNPSPSSLHLTQGWFCFKVTESRILSSLK